VAEHKEKSQLVGDFLRECAVLMFVLYPLEAYLQKQFDGWICFIVLAVAGIMLYWGTVLEGTDE
jgi:hypothetical protein